MLRLRPAPPPWCPSNTKRLFVIAIEDYTLSGPYGKGEWDTITFM